jgi:twitching motility protein PilT
MDKATVDALLTGMTESADHVSDLVFIEGKAPLVESHGRLQEFPIDIPGSVLTSQIVEAIAGCIINGSARLLSMYAESGSCDTSYEVPAVARFRVNIYKHNGGRALVMRKFPSQIPTLEGLALPVVFREMLKERNGIILVTGATGSGKTTTLAAMLNEINQSEPIHIVTLEDPIEFIYSPATAAISQRELGRDFESFAQGLRVALRQAPKAILIGEIRDRETMEIAMTASETGHIVFTTLHTINAGQTINRILGFFTRDEEEQVRYRLADTVRYIVSQRLVASTSGTRLLATEVIGSSLRTRESIRYGESEGKTFHEIIEAGSTMGWHSFDQTLLKAYRENLVTEETALFYSTDRNRMRRDIDLLLKVRGDAAQNSGSGLKMSSPGDTEAPSTSEKPRRAVIQPSAPTPIAAAAARV